MELQFQKSDISCLQPMKCQVQNQEQTQDIRLDDTQPGADKVLGAWGQVLLRGKQWRSGSVQVSGGVVAWVLYRTEDGDSQCVQTWVPVQVKMDIGPTDQDGTLMVHPLLRSVDARIIHARKLMVRVDVGVQMCAATARRVDLYRPEDLPRDVQVLEKSMTVCLPAEMGEKEFQIDELLDMPGSCPAVEQVLRYRLQPELIDRKVMSDKVVFRGTGLLHMLYRSTDGQLYNWDFELPFSQYGQLEGQFSPDAAATIVPAVTSLELERDGEGRLQVKAGLLGQYMIYEPVEITVAQDAYSTCADLTCQMEPLQLPAVEPIQTQSIHCEQAIQAEGTRAVDVSFLPDQPAQMRREGGVEMDLSGRFQMLYQDMQGNLETGSAGWSTTLDLPAGEESRIEAFAAASGMPTASMNGQSAALQADMVLDTVCINQQSLDMITGLTLEEPGADRQDRPGVILRPARKDSLWQIAKQCASTVAAIREANGLQDEPSEDQMLLIPVL